MPVAAVTGASRGLGRAIARMLAEEGFDLALGARSRDDLDRLADTLATDVLAHEIDITDHRGVEGFAEATADRFGAVDVLVANAGVGAFAPMAEFDLATFDQLFAVNVRGVFLTVQAFTRLLQAADAGMAVIVSSDVSARVFPGGGPYCATKHAVRAMARAYQQEQPMLRVLELRPGSTDTHFGGAVEGQAGPGVLTAEDVAQALRAAVRAPADVRVEELVVRSTGQLPDY